MAKQKSATGGKVEWHIQLLSIVLDMSVKEILEAGSSIPTQEAVEAAIAEALQQGNITAGQLEILEVQCGRREPNETEPKARTNTTQRAYAAANLSGSRGFLRLLNAFF